MRAKSAALDSSRSSSRAPSQERVVQDRLAQDQLAHDVHDALKHLYDLAYLQTHPLVAYAAREPGARTSTAARSLQRSLKAAIEDLQPETPHGSHPSRGHQLLTRRFVDGLPIEQVARELGISAAQYHREQRSALLAVVAMLRDRWGLSADSAEPGNCLEERVHAARLVAFSRPTRPRLPLPLTSFVGRDRELAEVKALASTSRLVTLTGTGGCGKTRLAYEAASSLSDSYPDGIQAVELAALADPQLVPGAIARALAVPDAAGRTTTEQLARHLASRRSLLVLDNCEHLADGCATLVETLLQQCPTLTVLATSREPLGVPGEVALRVPPLEAPTRMALPSSPDALVAAVTAYPAVRLFLDRAKAADPEFQIAEPNAWSVALICQRLDGIPLAIELAAPWVRLLSIDELLRRLEDRFRLLTGGGRTLARRQQTLLATVEWSYERLSRTERTVFARLSVLAGGWSLEAAEAVCRGGSIAGNQVLDLLARLVDKSLVVVDERSPSGVRYRLLETLREFGRERLEASGEGNATRDRHAEHYQELAERAEPELHGPRQAEWLARLSVDSENLRLALRHLLDQGDAEQALRLAGALWRYWEIRSQLVEGRGLLDETLARTSNAVLDDRGLAARAKVLQGAGTLAFFQADYETSRCLLEESVSAYRSLGDERGIAWSLIFLAWGVVDRGDPAGARLLLDEALMLARKAGDPLAEAWALARFGLAAMFLREFDDASQILKESAERSRGLHDRVGTAWSQHLLAMAYLCSDEPEPGLVERLELDSIATWRELGTKREQASSAHALALYYMLWGRPTGADSLLREALEIQVEIGDRFGMLGILSTGWGRLAALRGQGERIMRLLGAVGAARTAAGMKTEPAGAWCEAECAQIARGIIGEAAAEAAYKAGRAMTLDQAVEYALRDEPAD